MTVGASRDYKNGPKNNWRRTIWNEVIRRLGPRTKNEVVLYMPGPQDLDRVVAVDKGVPSGNLIAIDREWENVKRIRGEGHAAVHCEVTDAIQSWPHDWPVAAVMLDFCGGVDREVIDAVLGAMYHPAFVASVVSINLQRGRDSGWAKAVNRFRDQLMADMFAEDPARQACLKHRALQVLCVLSWMAFDSYVKNTGSGRLLSAQPDRGKEIVVGATRGNLESLRPTLFSYRSGRSLTFDSAVFTSQSTVKTASRLSAFFRTQRSVDVSRQIAAIRAVRTRRMADDA